MMKHHVLTKTVALLLCALFLLGAVGSAAGILVMAELDLYNRSYQDAWEENVESWTDGLSYNIGYRYASGALGGCNTQLLDQEQGTNGYYDIFDMSRVGYEVKDAGGEVLQQQALDPGTTPEYTFTFPIRGSYLRLVEEMTQQEWEQRQKAVNEKPIPVTPGETYLYDAVPAEGAEVYHMTVTFLDGNSEGVGSDEAFGYLYYDGSNNLCCRFYQEDLVEEIIPATVTHIVFADEHNSVLFEAGDPAGVGKLWYQAGDLIFFAKSEAMYESDAPETADPGLSSVIVGAQAVVNRKTPIWVLADGAFERQKYYYGKDYDVTIYATKVADGILYGCTTRSYLEKPDYHSEWVDLADVTFLLSPAISTDRGIRATCVRKTSIWALDGGECYDTGMWYQQGQEIGILVLGTFDSGEWGMTDLGWVRLSDLNLDDPTKDTAPRAAEAPETASQEVTAFAQNAADIFSAPNGEVLGQLTPGETFPVLQQENRTGIDWIRMDRGWVLAASVTLQDPVPQVTAQTETPEAVPQTYTTIDEVNVRANPHADAEVLALLPADTLVEVLQQKTLNGTDWALTPEGWIQAEFLMADAAATAADTPTEATGAPEEITFTIAPIDPTEEMVNLDQVTDGPVQAAENSEPTESAFLPEETTEPAMDADSHYFHYYNNDTGTPMVAGLTYEPVPEGYTVEIQLASGALRHRWEWSLLELCYGFRSELPKILGICALGFVLLIVYLCCAAAREPKSSELRPGGINRLPLDLYAFADVCIVAAAVALGVVAFEEFSDKNLNVALGTAVVCAYLVSLSIVSYIFAIAAQFKTPGGFWWRNSVCGLCVRLLGRGCRSVYHGYEKLGTLYDEKGEAAIVGFFKSCWKLVLFFWGFFVKICKWCYNTLARIVAGLGRKCLRFFSMLPLTWQWLMAGGAMIFFLFITMAGRYDMGIILSIFFAIGLVIYGSHAFGTLLEGVKRMNKGDLDEKVDDKLLVGSFKEFSDELNSLADVAVIAAQKQLKSERMKTELITNVSHDIKTPLTSIINYVDLMRKPHTPEEQAQYLEVLDRQSQRLKKLIDDLMEMSKASTGNLSVDIGIVDAGEAICQALGEFADKLEKAQLYPVFRQPEKRVEMLADGRLVWRVMSNLLSNAVKYALPGTRIYIDLAQVEDKVIISIKNISREELNVQADELLERFVRGDISRNTEGSGLGLNIAQSLMELQKGQLQLLVDGDLFKVTLIFPGA